MKIIAKYPIKARIIADLDAAEQFDFQKTHSKARTYRATRLSVEWQCASGKWTPGRVEWSGPMIRANGELSEAAGGSDSHNFGWLHSGGVRGEVAEVMQAMHANLPTVTPKETP